MKHYSYAWLLAAYDYTYIKPLEAHEGCSPGDEVWVKGYKGDSSTFGSTEDTMTNFYDYDLEMAVNANNTVVWDGIAMVCKDEEKEITVKGLFSPSSAYIVAK